MNLDGRGTETAINYIINANLENKPANMHFYLDENYTVELAVENGEIVINDFIPLSEVKTVKNVRIYWNWPLETGNTEEEIFKNDLIDSESMGKEMVANVTVTGIQVPPESKEASYKVYYYLENANDSNFTLYTTKTYSKNTDSELTLSNVAIDIPNAKYSYGSSTAGGEHISNITIAENGSTNVYLYYLRDRFIITTIAGENIAHVKSTGLSTGTSNDATVTTDEGEKNFEQSKTVMSTKYKWGETVTITADVATLDGYTNTFEKWSTSEVEQENNLGSSYNSTNAKTTITMPTEKVEITASATKAANTYSIVFDNNTGNGTMQNQNFTYDVAQNLNENTFTKTGYTFAGWNTKEDGSGTAYKNNELVKNLVGAPNGTITLYAQWSANEYIITFNANGGNGSMPVQTFKYDEQQALAENKFTRDGYTFTGWNLAQDGTDTEYANKEQILNLTEIKGENITMYAQWSANSYTVEFNSNGGTGTMQNQSFTYGVAKALRANTFTKEGYTFAGWSITADGSNINGSKIYADKEEISDLATSGTITLYAQWIKNKYTVVYNSNAPIETVTGTMENSNFTYDVSSKLTENKFRRTGYTFAKWNTKSDGTGESYLNSAEVKNLTQTPNGIVTLYAIWTPNTYRVNFNSNGGIGSMDAKRYTYGVTANLPANTFTKTGYTFAGWSTVANSSDNAENAGTIYNNGQEIINLVSTDNGSITLYAVWEANTNTQYTVVHYLMNTSGIYTTSEIENLTGTTDSELQINTLVKTGAGYNVPNGIYFSKATLGRKSGDNGESTGTTQITENIETATTTILPDGSLVINLFYARTYGYLTTVAGANITSVTEQSHKKYYYGKSVAELTATLNFEQGYLINFEKWESNNTEQFANIESNPIIGLTWPAMIEGTEITLTATATKVESDQTPYTVNYYLENANNEEYSLYSSKTLAGTTNAQITLTDVDINLANCTVANSNITETTIIAADGSTIINVYYNRNKFTLNVIGGTNIIEAKVSTADEQIVDNITPISIQKNLKWGASVNLSATIENVEGYTYAFTGWATESIANLGTNYDASKKSTEIIMPTENLTLTATASKTANTYTIVFNSNSGNGTMSNQIFTYGIAQNLKLNEFTKTGYTFKGWATSESLGNSSEESGNQTGEGTGANGVVYENGAEIFNLTTTPNEIITLYAVWADETAPELAITTTATTNSITATVTTTELGSGLTGNYKYYIGTTLDNGEIKYNTPIEISVETAGLNSTYTFEGLNENTEYYIKVEVSDKVGNVGTKEELVKTNILEGEVTFEDAYWSNGRYIVTVNTTQEDETGALYDIQYQVLTAEEIAEGKVFDELANWNEEVVKSGTVLGLKEENSGENEGTTTQIILKDGDILYARIYDGINGGETTYNHEIINKATKSYTETELAQVSYGTSTYDILAYSTKTDGFNVDIEKEITGVETYNYYAKANSESEYKLISTSTNWNDSADVSNIMLQELGKQELTANETYKVKVLTLDSNGNVTQCLNTATIITQAPAETGTTYAENRTYIDGENYTATIPAGFKVSSNSGESGSGDETTISKGMVLQDASGNEFVWVPVNNAVYIAGAATIPTNTSNGNTYYKPMAIAQSGSASNYESIVYSYSGVKSYRNTSNTGIGKANYKEPALVTGSANDGYTWNVTNPEGTFYDVSDVYYLEELGFSTIQEYGNYINKEYTNMVNSTNNFGGFYIGRYETSLNGTTAESKLAQTPMSNLNWYNLYLNQDSNRNSNNTYYETSSVTGSMVWGSQYDSMLNWVLTGTDKSKLQSSTYGNKSNAQALTGSYSNDVINNIYDLVANTYEWTQEAHSYAYRLHRGSSFNKSKTETATARGATIYPTIAGLGYGTRMALYINNSEDTTAPTIQINSVEASANTLKVNVIASDSGSGISKYHYSISANGQTWNTYTSYSPEYTYTGLAQNSTYYIKVQAEDNNGNMSIAETQEVITEGVSLEEGAIYVISVTGSSGNGVVSLGVRDDYAENNYYIQYQIVLGENAIATGKTADETNGIYTQITEDGTWVTGDVVRGLYENDIIYARLTDGTNTTPYTTVNVIGLETFSSIYSETQPYTDANGDVAYIPAGFSVGTSEKIKNIDDGLVIQDASGNQFVWVPVESALANGTNYPTSTSSTSTYRPMAIYQDNSTEYYQSLIYSFNAYAKALSYVNTGYKLGTSNYREPSLITGSKYDGYTWDLESLAEITGSTYDAYPTYYKTWLKFASVTEYGKYKNEEYKNMIDSVEYYKGFYVGRYETSIDQTTTPDSAIAQSQADKKVLDSSNSNNGGYRMIYYQDSNRNPNNPYYNSSSVTSSMIWNAQYNAMLNWILQKADNKEKVFSITLGNHKTATTSDLSGTNIDDLTNNIFDLGGNVQEVTQGSQSYAYYTARGGAFYRSSSYTGNFNMTYYKAWGLNNVSTSYNCFGTRMTLYLNKQNDTTSPTISIYGEPISTTNSITLKTRAKDENSGIAKYHYYISTNGTDFTEYIGWGNSYTFEGLTQNTTYYVKATVEDKCGNISEEIPVQTVTTNGIDGIEEILTTRVYGSNGDGRLYLGMSSEYEKQGYYVQYQIVKTGGTFNENGTWTKDATSTAKGLSIGDTVYARINDGNGNISYYKVVTVTELETFETYEEYSARVSTTATDIYYIYTDENGDTAYIPKDFSVGATSSINKVSTGLVVQDANGNQYVWVPVDKNSVVYNGTTVKTDGTDTYKPMVQYQAGYSETTQEQYFELIRYEYNKNYTAGSKIVSVSSGIASHLLGTSSYREPSLVTGAANYSWVFQASNNQFDAVSKYYQDICGFSSATEFGQYMNDQYTNMVESVKEYGGFYIGRFETSLTTGTVGSKLNTTAMNSRTGTETSSNYGNLWYGMYNKQDSNRNTNNPYYSSTTVVSSMIWGSQYDAMLNWVLQGSEAEMVYKRTGNNSGSSAKTGAYGVDVMNNIFDLSGNLYEWTQETISSIYRVIRGGSYDDREQMAISRDYGQPSVSSDVRGSRLALYLRSSEP